MSELDEITGSNAAAEVVDIYKSLVDREELPNVQGFRRRGWTVCPFGDFLDVREHEWLLRVASERGWRQAKIVYTNRSVRNPKVFVGEFGERALIQFENWGLLLSAMLVLGDDEFVVYQDDRLGFYAGKKADIEQATACTLERAWIAFHNFATSPVHRAYGMPWLARFRDIVGASNAPTTQKILEQHHLESLELLETDPWPTSADLPTVVESEWAYFDSADIQRRGWRAVPLFGVFVPHEYEWLCNAERLLGAIHETNSTALYAISLNPAEDDAWSVPMTVRGLLGFQELGVDRRYVLTSDTLEFSVLASGQNYFLVAGPLEFVERATCNSLDVLMELFLDNVRFANVSRDDNRWQEGALEVATACEETWD